MNQIVQYDLISLCEAMSLQIIEILGRSDQGMTKVDPSVKTGMYLV